MGRVDVIDEPGALAASGSGEPPRRVQVRKYDGRDLPYSTTIGSGSDKRTTITEYDGNSWLQRKVMPAGVDDNNGTPKPNSSSASLTSAFNAETYERDDDGLLTARNLPYDSADGPNAQRVLRRYKQTYSYTDRGLLRQVSGVFNGAGGGTPDHTTDLELNAAGWPTQTTSKDAGTDAGAVSMAFSYDKQGNQQTWSAPGGRIVSNRYFPSGKVRSRSGTRTSLYSTSGEEQLSSTEEQIYSFRYDRSGALSRMIDWSHHRVPNGSTADDRCDEAESDTVPARGAKNDDPRPTSITRDRASRPLRVDEGFTSDKDTAYRYVEGSPTQLAETKTNGAFEIFDPSVYKGGTRTEYAYDEQDRNTKVSVWNSASSTGPADRVTDMRWWPSGDQRETAKAKVNTSGSRTMDRRFYDTAGLASRREVTSASGAKTRTTTYLYDANGNRTKDERAGLNATGSEPARAGYVYNARNQLTSWTRSKNGVAPAKTVKDPAKTVTYDVDGAGRQRSVVESIVINNNDGLGDTTTRVQTSNTFVGDRLDRSSRKIAVSAGSSSLPDKYETDCFTYNVMGSQTRTLRKKTSSSGTECQSSRRPDTATGWLTQNQNTYDTFERLVASRQRKTTASDSSGTLGANEAYCYDGMDRRDRRLTNLDASGNPTEDDDDLTAFQKARAACSQDTTNTGIKVFDYSYLGLTESLTRENMPSGGVQTYEYTANGQRLGRLKQSGSTTPQWRAYDTDAQGSVIGLESPTTGEVSDDSRYDTDPYGKPVGPDDEQTPDAIERRENPFRFQGFYMDQETGNYDMQARTYRPETGQFLQQDRFADPSADLQLASDPLTASRYAFTAGNPSSYAEDDGHVRADESGRSQRDKQDRDAKAEGRDSPQRRAQRKALRSSIAVEDAYFQVTGRPLRGQGSSVAPLPPLKAAQTTSGGSGLQKFVDQLLSQPIIKANVYGEGPSANDVLAGFGDELTRIRKTYLSPEGCAAYIEAGCSNGFRLGDPDASSTTDKLLDLSAISTLGLTRGAGVLTRVEAAANRAQTERLARKIVKAPRAYSAASKRDLVHHAPFFLSREQLAAGRTFSIKSGDGVRRKLLQTPGELNDAPGIYEYIVGPEGVTHERFIRGGRVTGRVNGR